MNYIKLYFICVTYGLPYFSFCFVSLHFFLFFCFVFFSLFSFRFFCISFFLRFCSSLFLLFSFRIFLFVSFRFFFVFFFRFSVYRYPPTLICSYQSVGTVNFALPFTTHVTYSISTLQIFRFWLATSHLHPPMAFLSHNSSNTPGFAHFMNVLFWGRFDFQVSFLGRHMSINVWNRRLGSSMVGTGILPNNMRPSSECYTTFWMMTIYSDTLHW